MQPYTGTLHCIQGIVERRASFRMVCEQFLQPASPVICRSNSNCHVGTIKNSRMPGSAMGCFKQTSSRQTQGRAVFHIVVMRVPASFVMLPASLRDLQA